MLRLISPWTGRHSTTTPSPARRAMAAQWLKCARACELRPRAGGASSSSCPAEIYRSIRSSACSGTPRRCSRNSPCAPCSRTCARWMLRAAPSTCRTAHGSCGCARRIVMSCARSPWRRRRLEYLCLEGAFDHLTLWRILAVTPNILHLEVWLDESPGAEIAFQHHDADTDKSKVVNLPMLTHLIAACRATDFFGPALARGRLHMPALTSLECTYLEEND
ncbi:hypothetical protein AURDEDRAFT_182309, partial [Auricularia subglabra TFB-10046 SS5]